MSSLVGQTAPDFNLKTSEGDDFYMSSLEGNWKVIFFYAKAGSPTCKRGCLNFKEQYDLFKSLDPPVEIIGVSQDSIQQHNEFKIELNLPFTLLSDPDRKVAEMYKVPVHLGLFPAKSSFVIGPDNTIHYVYDWLFRPRKHVAKILDSLSNITEGSRLI